MRSIAYVRVSTEHQGDEGTSLRSQTLQLEEYVRSTNKLLEIVPGMEPGHGPIAGRPRFMEAIKKAKERGWKLLVLNPSRLSRDVDHLKCVDLRKTPVWICGEGPVSKERLTKGVERAAFELNQLRKDGGIGGRSQDREFQSEEARRNASEKHLSGGAANAERAHRNRLKVREYLEQHPGSENLTHQQLANALNAAGIMNRVKEKPITDKPWTVGSIRPVRKTAMERITMDKELLGEGDTWLVVDATPDPLGGQVER
ncbi:MAG: recombinase family protein [Yoonia sp.]